MPTIQDQKKMEALQDWFNNPQIRIDKPSDNAPHVFSADDIRIQGFHSVPLMVVLTEQENEAEGSGLSKAYKMISQIQHSDGTAYIVYHNMSNR